MRQKGRRNGRDRWDPDLARILVLEMVICSNLVHCIPYALLHPKGCAADSDTLRGYRRTPCDGAGVCVGAGVYAFAGAGVVVGSGAGAGAGAVAGAGAGSGAGLVLVLVLMLGGGPFW